MKRISSIILIIVLSLGVVMSGCGSNNTNNQGQSSTPAKGEDNKTQGKQDEKTQIVYWHWDGNPTSNPIYDELIERFEDENPEFEVEYMGLPADSYMQKYNTAVATKTVPDAAGFKGEDLASFVSQNALEPLDDIFNAWEEKDNFNDSVIDSVRSLVPDEKLYLIPFFGTLGVTWYNKQLFDEKKIEPPKTIDEFMKLCEEHANPSDGEYFFSLRGGQGSAENLLDFMLSYAGSDSLFDEEGNCNINDEKYVEALELYASIYWNNWASKDSITNSFKEMVAEFGTGTSMYIYHNSSSLPEHKKNLGEGNFANAAYPVGPEGKATTKALSINGPCAFKDAENKEGAMELVKYLASAEASSYICEQEGRLPVNSGVYEHDWYKNDSYLTIYQEMLESDNMNFFSHPIHLVQWAEFKSQVQEPDLQAVLLKEKTAKEVLDRWAELLTEYQKEYLSSIEK